MAQREVHERAEKTRRSLMSAQDLTAVSLFSSAGIGELGLEAAGLQILVANELIPYRASLYRANYPGTQVVEGDLWQVKDHVISASKDLLEGRELFLLYATPPCQGMSTNGAGKLGLEIAEGRRDHEDPRNRLIIPTIDVVAALRPRFVLLENVPQMANTVIRNEDDHPELILDYIHRRLGIEYVGGAEVLACEDFGIPQLRRRLLTIFTRDADARAYFEANSRSFVDPSLRAKGPTLREAIGHLPALDARPGRNERLDVHPQHRVPLMNATKYWWVSSTPEGATAFNNPCVNPECRSDSTPGHREALVDGKWTSLKDTPIFCETCGDLLPRPTVKEKDGSLRPLRGFHSAYRRMRWDQPARTLTQNFIYEASDNKIHPSQNRVLSVYEAMIIQTIDRYHYLFEIDGKDVGIPKIAEVIGESVAPLLIEKLVSNLTRISLNGTEERRSGAA